MADVAQFKRACDRCHAVKERCLWEVGKAACERCTRLKHDCHLRRPLQKVGRKSRGRRLINSSEYAKLSRSHGFTTSSSEDSSPSTDQSMGRSPGEVSTPSTFLQSQSSPREPAIFGCMSPLEQDLLRLCVGAQEAVGRFTIGPSFHRRHQRAMMTQLYSAFPQLKDAFLSCAPVLANQQDAHLPESMVKFCYSKAATAVSALRSFQVQDRQDVPISLALGVAVLTFALCISGGETFTLSRYALGLIKPYYCANTVLDSDEASYLICLTLAETIGCLHRGEMPTLKFEPKETDNAVDRYLGLSYPLLPQLHDLCEINHRLCHAREEEVPEIMTMLDSVDLVVQRWQPNPPSDFLKCFCYAEVVNILAQAKCLRLAILLVIQRLRYPYGTHDEEAMTLANDIMAEIELAMQVTEHSVKCTDLCLVAASLEQVDERGRRRAARMVDDLLHFSKSFRQTIKQQLRVFWDARDQSDGIYWYHLNRYWLGYPAH